MIHIEDEIANPQLRLTEAAAAADDGANTSAQFGPVDIALDYIAGAERLQTSLRYG